MIPLLDLKTTHDAVRDKLDAAYKDVLDSGWFINGTQVAEFEKAFAQFCNVDHVIGVGNGLDALTITLEAHGIGPGDEVLTAAHTFIATWLAIDKTGAKIIAVEPDVDTMNTEEDAYIAAITPQTRAIVPVHLYGQPVRLQNLRKVCDERGIFLLEDAAQAHGGLARGDTAGTMGHAATFSFYPGKNLGAIGDGGAIVTNDAALAEKCRKLSNYGSTRKYEHEMLGCNSRLDELQAAFLTVKLQDLAESNSYRRTIAADYIAALADVPNIILPRIADEVEHVWHLFVIRTDERDKLQELLASEGIGTGIHYPIANHHSGAFSAKYGGLQLPITERICETCLSLPIGPHLSSDDVQSVIAAVRKCAAQL